jgi:hypothetical protein
VHAVHAMRAYMSMPGRFFASPTRTVSVVSRRTTIGDIMGAAAAAELALVGGTAMAEYPCRTRTHNNNGNSDTGRQTDSARPPWKLARVNICTQTAGVREQTERADTCMCRRAQAQWIHSSLARMLVVGHEPVDATLYACRAIMAIA